MKSRFIAAAAVVLLAACAGDEPQPESTTAAWETTETGATVPSTATTAEEPIEPPQTEMAGRISIEEVASQLDSGDLVIVDVRSPQSYAIEHARGSVNIPLSEIADRANELPMGKKIVTYCT